MATGANVSKLIFKFHLNNYKWRSGKWKQRILTKNLKLKLPYDLKSMVWIEFRYFDLALGRPGFHPEDLMELFDKIVIKGIHTDSFDSRVREIRRGQIA